MSRMRGPCRVLGRLGLPPRARAKGAKATSAARRAMGVHSRRNCLEPLPELRGRALSAARGAVRRRGAAAASSQRTTPRHPKFYFMDCGVGCGDNRFGGGLSDLVQIGYSKV